MNWEAISAVGQILGAVAVLVTLLYLAIQVRQNTLAIATATYETIMTGFNDVNGIVVGNPQVASILHRGNINPSSLNDAEAIQYAFLFRCWSNQWFKLLRLHQRGSLSLEEWRPFAEEAAQAFQLPGAKLFKKENQLFAELYAELDKFAGRDISALRLGEKSPALTASDT